MKQLLKEVDAEAVFDPAAIDVLVAAFDAAWTTVLEAAGRSPTSVIGGPFARPWQSR